MKIKTSELTGPALDWAVAKCEAWVIGTTDDDLVSFVLEPSAEEMHFWPSTYWSHGGPIIERENIDVHAPRPVWPHWKAYKPEWNGGSGLMEGNVQYGPTLLITAMRSYVASKLGDEVEIPDELINKE